jgi:hypothetical protein
MNSTPRSANKAGDSVHVTIESRDDAAMREELIAPCGMNCSLCVAYQFKENDINKRGFHKKTCSGCIPRGINCVHMADACDLLGQGRLRFCFQCDRYPCKRLKDLDKRYRTKYHMSMIDNLNFIQARGLEAFLVKEAAKWACPACGAMICCHNGLCLRCDLDRLRQNKAYRWNEQDI